MRDRTGVFLGIPTNQFRLLKGAISGAAVFFFLTLAAASAAPYAGMVIDARNGEVLYEDNAHARLHPASLTKMMTLYVAFEAVENGEISLDTKVRISRNAASEQPSKLGLKAGSRIAFRYLIRATAVRSANDAATAIAEAIEGSEQAFANRMTRAAKRMGMTHTTFRNAHGLTQSGQLSSARDMSILARHLIYDYPDYYNLFSRIETYAGIKTVASTNRRFLRAYNGADGIKTGYTRAAGYNLVASARKGNVRIIATVFGGKSTQTRNNHVADLLNRGFRRAKKNVALRKPVRPLYTKVLNAGKSEIRLAVVPVLRPEEDHANEDKGEPSTALIESQGLGATVPTEVGDLSENQDWNDIRPIVPVERPRSESVLGETVSNEKIAGINLGMFPTMESANKRATRVLLFDQKDLLSARKHYFSDGQGIVLKYLGMTEDAAKRACDYVQHRELECSVVYVR